MDFDEVDLFDMQVEGMMCAGEDFDDWSEYDPDVEEEDEEDDFNCE